MINVSDIISDLLIMGVLLFLYFNAQVSENKLKTHRKEIEILLELNKEVVDVLDLITKKINAQEEKDSE